MQIKDSHPPPGRSCMMIAVMLVAAGMCLQGGEQVDVSRYVSATARLLELKVTLAPANGTLVVYSPGYEEQRAQFSEELSFGRIRGAGPLHQEHRRSIRIQHRHRIDRGSGLRRGSGVEPAREEQS
jgi:hypothetical protein